MEVELEWPPGGRQAAFSENDAASKHQHRGSFCHAHASLPSSLPPTCYPCLQEIDVAGAAEAILHSKRVLIVPGYGLAAASAQYAIAELVKARREKGASVT